MTGEFAGVFEAKTKARAKTKAKAKAKAKARAKAKAKCGDSSLRSGGQFIKKAAVGMTRYRVWEHGMTAVVGGCARSG